MMDARTLADRKGFDPDLLLPEISTVTLKVVMASPYYDAVHKQLAGELLRISKKKKVVESQWVTITDDPGTLPAAAVDTLSELVLCCYPDGTWSADVYDHDSIAECGHGWMNGNEPFCWREIGPLPAPPKADSSLTK
jgi:hypothetical protein